MTQELSELARDGVLRAAINTGNRALVREQAGMFTGISPALARRLADLLGVRLELVIYPGAGKVFAEAGSDQWDVAFLAIDQTRALQVSFTRPYHMIEATYAVRSASPFHKVSDADRNGVHILAATGSAYDLHLSKTLRNARLDRCGTPSESFDAFRAGRGDMVAGVRASLECDFGQDAEFRILPGAMTQVSQAMVLAGRDNPLTAALDAFVAEAIENGFVAREIGV